MNFSNKKRVKKKGLLSPERKSARLDVAYKPYKMRILQAFWLIPLALVIGFGSVVGFFIGEETRNSKFQSDYFSQMAREISFVKKAGPSPDFQVPASGPYNQRLGYSYLPFFIKVLEAEGYEVTNQMRVSPRYKKLVNDGVYPIYRPKTEAGLLIKDRDSHILHRASFPSHVYPDLESVPRLLVATLLFIENRELLREGAPTRNPVIEWDRFAYAALGQALKKIVPTINLGGGSTLATQIEKFRFSPDGQTKNVAEKLRQIVSGSLRVYMDGPDTRDARHQIVLDYLNSTPLSGRAGFGEINSIGDGLWVWFGRDLEEVKKALDLPEEEDIYLRRKAIVYREVLGLILAQRRPTYYLVNNRAALEKLIDRMLDTLCAQKIISVALRDATRAMSLHFFPKAPSLPQMVFLDNKANNSMRNHLLSMLGLHNLYELDRVDLSVTSTLDSKAQSEVTDFLKKMAEPSFLQSKGLYGEHLLSPDNDPSVIHWSVLIYEKTSLGNVLRVQTDNIDGPLDMNEGVKLDLGSTAKLRTLVTYLEIIGELHKRYAGLSREDLDELAGQAPDALTLWATKWLASEPKATLEEMLKAAMGRVYSANPNETFFTGGGTHNFVNFSETSNYKKMDLWEALRHSVNLVFIRLMRDIVNYSIAQGPQTKKEILKDPDHPARKKYLERFADKEGTVFLDRYITLYDKLSGEEILQKISQRTRQSAIARTILFRSLYPQADFGAYLDYMKNVRPQDKEEAKLKKLFAGYPPDRYSLADRGYIAGVNPLELWLVGYKLSHPNASQKTIIEVSRPIRLESYSWLLNSNKKGAQDSRIRTLLELDAFARIQSRWARLGYPFEKLVPSLATAIGTSADKPAALAKLVGIILNDGASLPMRRFESLHFAKGTPYETELGLKKGYGQQVFDPAIAKIVREAMKGVVENGTAHRLYGAYVDKEGKILAVGAKTGTGDHRFDEYSAGHRLISSRVVNRTGTIVFFIGDHLFGTVTAHVAGEKAAHYKFTSALSAQVLKSLAPSLQSLITPEGIKIPVVPVVPDGAEDSMPVKIKPYKAVISVEKKPVSPPVKKREKKEKLSISSQEMMMDILP